MDVQHSNRNCSLDVLRILCMIMIVTLHFLSHGNMLDFFFKNELPYYIVAFIRGLCICSVNVFVLISGFFMVNKDGINFKRLLSIIFSVLFYSWLYLGLNIAFRFTELDFKGIITSVFPISYKLYWFPTCYLFVYLLSPFLNRFLKQLSVNTYRLLLMVLFVLFSISSEIIPMSDPFGVVNGYSAVWFVFLYCLAGYIRIHGFCFKMSSRKWLMLYFISVTLMFLADIILSLLSSHISLLERYGLEHHFSRYCSVLVTLESLSLFMFFKNVNINNSYIKSVSKFLAPLTFGVYLIHDNPIIRNFLYESLLKLNNLPHNLLAVPIMIGLIMIVFFAACFIEFGRKTVFMFFEKSKAYESFVGKIQSKFNSMLNK